MTSDTQVKGQFWSIERAVAFVVAPIATAGSGALALWLGAHFPGVHVTGGAIYAFASTVSLGTAGAFIKWLDGRQKFIADAAHIEAFAVKELAPVSAALPETERKSLLHGIEGIVAGHTAKIAAAITASAPSPTASTAEATGGATVTVAPVEPPVPEPSWTVPNDPAPGGDVPPPPAAVAGDSGAAVAGS